MTVTPERFPALRQQSGLTYVEVMLATVIIALALVPAIEALHTGVLGTEVYESTTADQYAALSKMEQVLAEPHSALIFAAAEAGKANDTDQLFGCTAEPAAQPRVSRPL